MGSWGASHGNKLYDELIKVPLIIHGCQKSIYRSLTDHKDLAPAILEIAGIKKPREFIGNDDVFNLEGNKFVYSECPKIDCIKVKIIS